MVTQAEDQIKNYEQDCQVFLDSKRTMVLSSLSRSGILETSVAPFVQIEGRFYVYLSDLAQHSQNLKTMAEENEINSNSCLLSALIVADEIETNKLFARERLSLQLVPTPVSIKTVKYTEVMELFHSKFGGIVEVLQGLDFHLFELNCQSGSYVKGFGQAFAFKNCPCQKLAQKIKQ